MTLVANHIDPDHPVSWLLKVYRLMGRCIELRLQDRGLSEVQWRIIGLLNRSAGLSQTELALLVDIQRAPMGEHIDRLEATGWVSRQQDPNDRRTKRIFLTPFARGEIAPMSEGYREFRLSLRDALGEPLWVEMQKALSVMADEWLPEKLQRALQRLSMDDATHLIGIVARCVNRRIDSAIKVLGFTRSRWNVLITLAAMQGCSQTELAQRLFIQKAPLGQLIDELERDGWLERQRDPNDRRVNRLQVVADQEVDLICSLQTYYSVGEELLLPLDHSARLALTQGLQQIFAVLSTQISD